MQIARFDAIPGPLDEPMALSDATGRRLLKHGDYGADLIRFPAGGRVGRHRHPGCHMLFVTLGLGWLDCGDESIRLEKGLCYCVPEGAWHAIRAETDLTLISIAFDHRDVASPERLEC